MSDDRRYLTWEVWSAHIDISTPLLMAAFTYQHEALAYGARVQFIRNWTIITVVEVDA